MTLRTLPTNWRVTAKLAASGQWVITINGQPFTGTTLEQAVHQAIKGAK